MPPGNSYTPAPSAICTPLRRRRRAAGFYGEHRCAEVSIDAQFDNCHKYRLRVMQLQTRGLYPAVTRPVPGATFFTPQPEPALKSIGNPGSVLFRSDHCAWDGDILLSSEAVQIHRALHADSAPASPLTRRLRPAPEPCWSFRWWRKRCRTRPRSSCETRMRRDDDCRTVLRGEDSATPGLRTCTNLSLAAGRQRF
jgi:hypothetical protein